MAIVRKTTSLREQVRAVVVYFGLTVALQVGLSLLVRAVPLGLAGVSAWALSALPMISGYAPPAFAAGLVGVVFVLGPATAFLLGRWGTRPAVAGLVAAVVVEVCASALVFVGLELYGASV